MGVSTSHTATDTLARLLEEAFDGDPSHSLLANLHNFREEDWAATPGQSGRSIADILEHVGWSKWLYEDYALGSASRYRIRKGLRLPRSVRRAAGRLRRLRAGTESHFPSRWASPLLNH
jgi:hypothetical protein